MTTTSPISSETLSTASREKNNIRQIYDFWAGTYSRWGHMFDKKRFDHVTDYLDLGTEHSLLDVGTGPGIIPFALRKLGYMNSMTGFDLSPGVIGRAHKKLKGETENNLTFFVGDMEHMPLPDQSFDRLTCVETLLLAEDKPKVMREFQRVLKDGGKGLVVAPNQGGKKKRFFYRWFNLALKTFSIFKKDLRGVSVDNYRGKAYLSPDELAGLVDQCGMSVESMVQEKQYTFCVFKRNGKTES